jgi:hypothetical protein
MCSQTKQQASDAQRPSASLWIRLIIGLVAVSLLAVAAASGALYFRFKAKNTEFHEQTLRNQASLITDYLKKAPPGCVYRKPKRGRSGDEVRLGSRVN